MQSQRASCPADIGFAEVTAAEVGVAGLVLGAPMARYSAMPRARGAAQLLQHVRGPGGPPRLPGGQQPDHIRALARRKGALAPPHKRRTSFV